MSQLYDIAVLGATPAGCAAAYYLARKKLRVALIDSPRTSSECPLSDWAPREFFSLPHLPKGLARDCRAVKFTGIHYHNADLNKEVKFVARATAGYFVRWGQLTKVLSAAATAAGARLCTMVNRPAIHLGEESVRLLSSSQVTAKILLIAQGSPHDVLGDLALPVRTVQRSSFVAAGLDIPMGAKALAGGRMGDGLHVVESKEQSELGMFFQSDGSLHVRVVSSSVATGTRAAELVGMMAGLQKAGILPPNLPLDRAKGAVWYPPAGEALELETHVAKRSVLAGTAGGFADTITGQTLTPSVRSAILAADAAIAALGAKDPQDALMRFKSDWRKELADYLRPPSTSLHMLLPLLFVNQRIVTKFTRALLYGESI